VWERERYPRPESYLAVRHSTVYFIDLRDNALCALDAKTGQLRWSLKPGGEVRRSPVVADGFVYFHRLYAVDAITGDLKWKFYTTTHGSRVAIADGIVYFGAGKTCYAVNGQTGDEVWHREIGSWVHWPPAVSEGLVYISTAKALYALNAETGDVKWTFGPLLWADKLPIVVEGLVYLTDGPGLQVIDAQNGEHVWCFDAPGKIRGLAPAVADGIVYFAQTGYYNWNKLYALDAKTGALKHTIELRASAPPSVADGLLFVPSYDGHLYAVERDSP
jgi:outer membrane protein assembly factor BamB